MRRRLSLLPHPNICLVACCLLGTVPALAAVPRDSAATDGTELLLLSVFINGRDSNLLGEFTARGGKLFATGSELRAIGMNVPDGNENAMISLSTLAGVTYRVDERRQELHISAPVESLALTRIAARGRNLADIPLSRSTGALLNYDLVATAVNGQLLGNGLVEARGFSPWGVITSGLIANAWGGGVTLRRLDSTYSFADPDTLSRTNVGDVISGGLPWSRAVRFGGVQLATDFGLRPDLITFPLPDIAGQAAVPSTVDVLVNGVQQLRRNVDPGPFEIQQLPVVSGAGNVTVLVSDATGQQSAQTLPFYASGALLAPGLSSMSVEIGAIRKNFATESDHYGRAAGALTFRYGANPKFTWEAHVEVTPELGSFGTGAVVGLGNVGVLSVAGAISTSQAKTGTAIHVGVERSTQTYRLGASASIADDKFRDIAAMNGDRVPRKVLQANGGLTLGSYGSLGAAYTFVERLVRTTSEAETTQRTSTLSATYSKQLSQHAQLYGTAIHSFGPQSTSAVIVGLSARIGEDSSVAAGGDSGPNGMGAYASLSKPALDVGDAGFQFYARGGKGSRALGGVEYKAPWAFVSAAADVASESSAARIGIAGAVAFLRGRILPSTRIQDSFAVVDSGGVAGVRVFRENRLAGQTDSRGFLVIPDLRSFDANKIAIDPSGLPLDADISSTSLFLRPHDRSGVLARFDIRQRHSALIALHDGKGAPLALGSTVLHQQTGAKIPVGYDGLAYVVGLEARNALSVTLPDSRRCSVSFAFTPAPGTVQELGPLTCVEERR